MLNRLSNKSRVILAVLLIPVLIGAPLVHQWFRADVRPIPGRTTTYITAPLTPDGWPDIPQWAREKNPAIFDAERNGARELLPWIYLDEEEAEEVARIYGVSRLLIGSGDHEFLTPQENLIERLVESCPADRIEDGLSLLRELDRSVTEIPWTAKDLPELAHRLEASEKLAALMRAVKGTTCCLPPVADDKWGIGYPLPGYIEPTNACVRHQGGAVSGLGMLQIGNNEHASAFSIISRYYFLTNQLTGFGIIGKLLDYTAQSTARESLVRFIELVAADSPELAREALRILIPRPQSTHSHNERLAELRILCLASLRKETLLHDLDYELRLDDMGASAEERSFVRWILSAAYDPNPVMELVNEHFDAIELLAQAKDQSTVDAVVERMIAKHSEHEMILESVPGRLATVFSPGLRSQILESYVGVRIIGDIQGKLDWNVDYVVDVRMRDIVRHQRALLEACMAMY